MKYADVLMKKAAIEDTAARYEKLKENAKPKGLGWRDIALMLAPVGLAGLGAATSSAMPALQRKAERTEAVTGVKSPYLHDYFGGLANAGLLGTGAGLTGYGIARLANRSKEQAADIGTVAGLSAAAASILIPAALAAATRKRTPEEQAVSDRTSVVQRYLSPGLGSYNTVKRLMS